MRKFLFISIFITLFFTAVQAQDKKYIYKDTTLEQAEELYDTSAVKVVPVEEANTVVEEKVVEEKQETTQSEIDTTLYYTKLHISPDSIMEWKNLKAFAYVKYLDSLLKAKKEKAKKEDKADETNYTPPSGGGSWLDRVLSSGGIQVFLWVLAIGFVVFILYKLFLTEGAFRKTPKSNKINTPNAEEEIITSHSDFDILIKQAVQTGNYRLAVRYQYLQTLHKLAGKNLVELATDKTNYQYVREITNQNYQQDFAALTLNYEYVWYGGFDIDVIIYKRMETGFLQLNNKL
jgi:hypothetical protein